MGDLIGVAGKAADWLQYSANNGRGYFQFYGGEKYSKLVLSAYGIDTP